MVQLQAQIDQGKADSNRLKTQLNEAAAKSADLQAKLDEAQSQITLLKMPKKK